MGYYIEIVKSDAKIAKEHLDTCYEKMCSLNMTHDNEKRGGSWSGGKQEGKWFSWMDANYPDTCKDAQAIFEQMGFETSYNENGDLLLEGYNNKMGQEDLFLKAIENIASGSIYWRGEDGSTWSTKFYGDNVFEAEPTTKKIGTNKLRLK
jgi:hypothetical protein